MIKPDKLVERERDRSSVSLSSASLSLCTFKTGRFHLFLSHHNNRSVWNMKLWTVSHHMGNDREVSLCCRFWKHQTKTLVTKLYRENCRCPFLLPCFLPVSLLKWSSKVKMWPQMLSGTWNINTIVIYCLHFQPSLKKRMWGVKQLTQTRWKC